MLSKKKLLDFWTKQLHQEEEEEEDEGRTQVIYLDHVIYSY